MIRDTPTIPTASNLSSSRIINNPYSFVRNYVGESAPVEFPRIFFRWTPG